MSQRQGHSAAGRIMSMKNSNDNIRNQTRDLLTCSAVLQPSALLRAPTPLLNLFLNTFIALQFGHHGLAPRCCPISVEHI